MDKPTRYRATIAHHSIARARYVWVGDSLHQAKINASREFSGERGDYSIVIEDTQTAEIGNHPMSGNYAMAAVRRVAGTGWVTRTW